MADDSGPLRRAMETIRTLRAKLDAANAVRRVAIVGMGLRGPGAINDRRSYWSALAGGDSLITELPADRRELLGQDWEGVPTAGGYLSGVLDFDAEFFGISPREARAMDPQHRLLLEVVWEAFEDAAIPPEAVAASTGVFLGITGQDYRAWSTGVPNVNWLTGNGHCFAAGRIAYTLGLEGPALAIDTACSSSLVAIHTACRALAAGDCAVAVAAGVNLILSPQSTREIGKTGAFSPAGSCRPFDARADGFVRGEGAGALLLKPLDAALRDGDRVLAVIEGSVINQDGRSTGLTAPNVAAQTRLITSALTETGLTPADIGYLETHGTGTPLGDPIELEAVAASIGRRAGRTVYIGSTKASIGHAEAAAGLLGLAKAVLCLRHRAIPPQASFDTLNPRIDLTGTQITIPVELTPWGDEAGSHAAVSSFGMSGTNAHAILSAAPRQNVVRQNAAGFPISADSQAALAALARRYAERLTSLPADDYGAFAYTATAGRTRRRCTRWIDAADASAARTALSALAAGAHHPRILPADESVMDCPSLTRSVISLPAYPWQRRRYSIRAAPAA